MQKVFVLSVHFFPHKLNHMYSGKFSLSLSCFFPMLLFFPKKYRHCLSSGNADIIKASFPWCRVAHYSPWHHKCITQDTSCPWIGPTSITFPRADSIDIISLWLLLSLWICYLTSLTSSPYPPPVCQSLKTPSPSHSLLEVELEF